MLKFKNSGAIKYYGFFLFYLFIHSFRYFSYIIIIFFTVILKDVSHTVMSELLQFMYQGVVNVKHAELSAFMKIAQALQIKGLAMSSGHQQHHNTQKSPSSPLLRDNSLCDSARNLTTNSMDNYPINLIENKINSALFNSLNSSTASLAGSHKRSSDFGNGIGSESTTGYSKKQRKRSSDVHDHDISAESMESSDEVFMPPPQVSMVETSRFDLSNVKREASDTVPSPSAIRNLLPPQFNFDYNGAYNKNADYLSELHNNNDVGKSTPGNSSNGSGNGNHMDIPAGKFSFFFVIQTYPYLRSQHKRFCLCQIVTFLFHYIYTVWESNTHTWIH